MAQSIGFFQFDNLVRGRVGFIFVNLGIDTNAVYPHVFKMHLEQKLLQLPEGDLSTATDEQILSVMSQQPKESAVIVLDQQGVRSEKLANALEAAGFINTFYVKGGWDQFLKDRT
ncbi:MAG: rhodanese-like domain-containing protein [Bdellovibrionales bacterium]|nr:rhodanese-like domain-containing protein [Bdellovibrionales bacterium]